MSSPTSSRRSIPIGNSLIGAWLFLLACTPGVCVVAEGALAGRWALDEHAGVVAADASGGANALTVRGDVKWTRGRIDGAVALNGRSDLYVEEASPALRPTSGLTVTAWVKADPDLPGPGWVAAQGDNYGLVVNRYRDGGVFFYYCNGVHWIGVGSGDVNILDGKWHHLAGVLATRANTLSVYKDGLRVGTASATGPVKYLHGVGFTIGSMQGARWFRGALDDVRVYDRVLTQDEMERIAMTSPNRQDEELSPTRRKRVPVGVIFHRNSIYRTDNSGDNWCLTWAADDSQITSMCDGSWLDPKVGYHTHLYRILGGPERFRREDLPDYPGFSGPPGSWFGYGLVSVDGILYATVSKTPGPQWSGPFRGIKLLKSPDNGNTWYRVDRHGRERRFSGPNDPARNEVGPEEMFFLEEFGVPHQKQQAYPFSFLDFVQRGQDSRAARDGYVYIYSPEGAHANRLLLARTPKDKLGVRDAWEYFVRYRGAEAVWSGDIRQRGTVHVFPAASRDGNCFGWYSWLPSVVWNEGLGLYLMVNGGTYAGHGMTAADGDYFDAWMHTRTGSLGFWYAENPWGPWRAFYYTDYWTADSPRNRTYQPKLSPKWISADGRDMILIWSDAMADSNGKSHTVNYTWNQMPITIQVQP